MKFLVKYGIVLFATGALMITSGCKNDTKDSDSSTDTTYPTPGGGSSTNITTTLTELNETSSIDLSWNKSTDNISAQADLEYKVVYSLLDNIGTLSDANTNGTEGMVYTKDTTSTSVSGLNSGTKYYFNVIVKDETGNEAVYTSSSFGTRISGTVTKSAQELNANTSNSISAIPLLNGDVFFMYGDNNDTSQKYITFDSSGSSTGSATLLDSDNEENGDSARMTDGRVVVAYDDDTNGGKFQILSSDLSTTDVPETNFDTDPVDEVKVAVFSGGKIIFVYDEGGSSFKFITYDPITANFGTETTILGGNVQAFDVTAFDDNNVLVTFANPNDSNNGNFVIVDSSGSAGSITDFSNSTAMGAAPKSALQHDGDILVAYTDNSNNIAFVDISSSGSVSSSTSLDGSPFEILGVTMTASEEMLIMYTDTAKGYYTIYSGTTKVVSQTEFLGSGILSGAGIPNISSVVTLEDGTVVFYYLNSGQKPEATFIK